ncbi:MAG: hypothetical protein PHP62_03320 [Candidatus Moranbacteria bacterium]|nr:hypothetical protein [Candidatus Moranbacteria bacterium]
MKKIDAQSLIQIWHSGSEKALRSIIQRKPGELTENILFNVWSNTIQEMYQVIPGKDGWLSATKKDKLLAFEGKYFSLKNFEEMTLGPQIELRTNNTAH